MCTASFFASEYSGLNEHIDYTKRIDYTTKPDREQFDVFCEYLKPIWENDKLVDFELRCRIKTRSGYMYESYRLATFLPGNVSVTGLEDIIFLAMTNPQLEKISLNPKEN